MIETILNVNILKATPQVLNKWLCILNEICLPFSTDQNFEICFSLTKPNMPDYLNSIKLK